jgi:hypothetical protein
MTRSAFKMADNNLFAFILLFLKYLINCRSDFLIWYFGTLLYSSLPGVKLGSVSVVCDLVRPDVKPGSHLLLKDKFKSECFERSGWDFWWDHCQVKPEQSVCHLFLLALGIRIF